MLVITGQGHTAAQVRQSPLPPGEVDDRVAARLARQSLFARERPAAFTF